MSETVTMVRERPILFGGALVRAILDGRKTQTRRVMKPQPPEWIHSFGYTCFTPEGHISGRGYWKGVPGEEGPAEKFFRCPYGVPGDRLWVRESWNVRGLAWGRKPSEAAKIAAPDAWVYKADGHPAGFHNYGGWRPSIHMPRAASRITLEITDVRVERLQEITGADVEAEGVAFPNATGITPAELAKRWEPFRELWDSINARRGYGWDANPWVWVIGFLRIA